MKLAIFLRTPFSSEHLWWQLLKPKNVFNFHGFLLWLAFCLKRGFTNNPDFICFKWKLKKKHSLAKCVICKTEIRRVQIVLKHLCYYSAEHIFFSPHDVFIFLHTYVCSFYFLVTLPQKEWRQNMFFFFLLIERDALN